MSVFSYLSYRECLQELASDWKKMKPGRSLQRLAESSGLHTPHLSNVTKAKAHLSQDQLYSICQALALVEQEQEYLSLLLEWERSGVLARRTVLKEKIDEVRKEKFKSETHLKAKQIKEAQKKYDKVYLNPELYLTYLFLGLKQYREDISLIERSLKLSENKLKEYMTDLENMKLIVREGGKILTGEKHFHLSQESELCDPHQSLMSYLSLNHMSRLPKNDKYGFQVTFTANKQTRDSIHELFLDFIQKSEDLVRNTEEEDQVYQFNFQLFPWSVG